LGSLFTIILKLFRRIWYFS